MPCPDANTSPRAHWIWNGSDESLRSFILEYISNIDYEGLGALAQNSSAHAVYVALKQQHEKLGLWAQLNFMKKALDVRFNCGASISVVISKIRGLHNQIMAGGPMNMDQLLTAFLINTMDDEFPHLQSQMQAMTKEPNFSSNNIIVHLQEEEATIKRQEEQGETALAAMATRSNSNHPSSSRQQLYCTNCKQTNHSTDFCIRQEGKMAGKTIEEACTAQHLALGKLPKPTTSSDSTHVATNSKTDSVAVSPLETATTPSQQTARGPPIVINGTQYFPESQPTLDAANLATHDA